MGRVQRRTGWGRVVLAVAVLVASGCGYHLAGTGPNLPATASSITIEAFTNRTRERGLEIALQRAIEEEFRRRGTLRVVTGGEGDLVLSGTIRRFGSTPIGFGAGDEAVRYSGILQASVRLRDRASGRILFRSPALVETLDFAATPGVVVTSSPRFQQGTIDSRDLVLFSNVQIGEARRREALAQLIQALAHDVYLQAMEGF